MIVLEAPAQLGVYADVEDLRAEGIGEDRAEDERLRALIHEASRTIDRWTGSFFTLKPMTLLLDGRGASSIEPPYPPVAIEYVGFGPRIFDGSEIRWSGASAVSSPRISLPFGVFPAGRDNIEVKGTWGHVERDLNGQLATPAAIRRACLLLVMRSLPLLGDDETSMESTLRGRLVSEKTRDQSYTLAPVPLGPMTGDLEVDRILEIYRRSSRMGAA